MKSAPFRPINTSELPDGSTLLDRVQKYVKDALDRMARKLVDNENVVRAAIGVGDTRVFHGLGQKVTTWDVVDIGANAVVWQSPTVNAQPALVIILRASAPVNVAIRFT